ncbi:hypothetical protein V7S43_004138 [Phytophthora oleae]|uniref:M96 mating-specific protein family n=1 Tax=Phytophthora oleae TaxID=2107226 RepID=A0ABD3FVK8_9STRA
MSFLEQTTDDVVTVAEAIAFIDAFEAKSGSDQASSSSETLLTSLFNDKSSSSSAVRNTQKTVVNGKSKRKKKANPPGYTTEIQRRKRAELQSLRSEAHELEERLNLLQQSKPSSHLQHVNEDVIAFRSKWNELVEIERARRQHSEETNRRLRALLSHYLAANRNLGRVLEKKTLLKGLDFVFGNEPTPTHSFAAFENSKAIAGHLEKLLGTLYLESGSLVDSWGSSAISYSMCMKFDKKRGRVAEMKATTPVACPVEEAAHLMWLQQCGHRPDPLKWARRMPGRKPNSQEKNWILTLQCQSYVKKVTGIQLLQKFEEPNRIVLVKTDLMTLTTEGLQFRNFSWTIITRSETNPQSSVVRIYEEIFLDCQQDFTARPEDITYAQNVVLKNLSWKLHDCTQKLQDALLQRFEVSNN